MYMKRRTSQSKQGNQLLSYKALDVLGMDKINQTTIPKPTVSIDEPSAQFYEESDSDSVEVHSFPARAKSKPQKMKWQPTRVLYHEKILFNDLDETL